MWTVVYIAHNRQLAEELKEALVREGILAMVRPVGLNMTSDQCNHEVLVPESEAEDALALVNR